MSGKKIPAGYEPHAWAVPGIVRAFWGPPATFIDELLARGEGFEVRPYHGMGSGPAYPHVALRNVRVEVHRRERG